MGAKPQSTAPRTVNPAFFHVTVSEAVFTGGLAAENGEGEEKPFHTKSLRLIGRTNDRIDHPQIRDLSCEVDFVIDNIKRYQIQSPPSCPIIGQALYSKFAEGEGFAVSILCTSEYFERVKDITTLMVSSMAGEADLSIGVLDFPRDWRPADSKLGNSTFWVTSVDLQWRAGVGQRYAS